MIEILGYAIVITTLTILFFAPILTVIPWLVNVTVSMITESRETGKRVARKIYSSHHEKCTRDQSYLFNRFAVYDILIIISIIAGVILQFGLLIAWGDHAVPYLESIHRIASFTGYTIGVAISVLLGYFTIVFTSRWGFRLFTKLDKILKKPAN